MIRRSERPRSTVPVDYCVPAAAADTRRQLRSSNRRLFCTTTLPAQYLWLPGLFSGWPHSLELSPILSGTRPPVQTASDACLRRTCLLDTSALSALEVL